MWGICPWHVLLLHKRSESTPSPVHSDSFLFSCRRLLLVSDLMKAKHLTSCCYFSCLCLGQDCMWELRVCGGRKVPNLVFACTIIAACVKKCFAGGGMRVFGMHLSSESSINWNPSLSIVQHVEQKGSEVCWIGFTPSASACCMNTICQSLMGVPFSSVCIVFAGPQEGSQFSATVHPIFNQDCVQER